MSFILDALKKSEHKRSTQAGQQAIEIYEPRGNRTNKRRSALQLLLIFLLLGILMLLVVVVLQRPWEPTAITESKTTDGLQEPVVVSIPVSESSDVPIEVSPVSQSQVETAGSLQPVVEERSVPAVVVAARSPIAAATASPDVATEEEILYSFAELPADVRGRLPVLQMALHAYNANDAGASLIQINGRLIREGAHIGDNLTVEEITANGAILRTDRYRFLLPRRGQ